MEESIFRNIRRKPAQAEVVLKRPPGRRRLRHRPTTTRLVMLLKVVRGPADACCEENRRWRWQEGGRLVINNLSHFLRVLFALQYHF